MMPSVDPRIWAALIVAVMFFIMSNMANAGSLPSEVCAQEATEAEKQTCLVGYVADASDAYANPGWVFVADAGPAVAVVVTGLFAYRLGRGL